jgi:hypothetical protein
MKRSRNQEQIVEFVIGQLSGDGTMTGRMASAKGAWTPPKGWYDLAAALEFEGFTADNVAEELDRRWAASKEEIAKRRAA